MMKLIQNLNVGVVLALLLSSSVFGQQILTNGSGGGGGGGTGNNTYCADATGSTTTYTCPTPTPTPSTLSGLLVSFVPQTTNSGSSTLNIAGLGAKTLKQSDCSTNLAASALIGGSMYLFSYNGTVFCQSAGAGSGGASEPYPVLNLCPGAGCTLHETSNFLRPVIASHTITAVTACVGYQPLSTTRAVPTVQSVIVDILQNGTTIFGGSKPTIAVSGTCNTVSGLSVAVAANDVLVAQIAQADTAGAAEFVTAEVVWQ
jgi:hypothetical protein